MAESPVQIVLRRKRVKLLELKYTFIASHLISSGHLTEGQHEEIKNNTKDAMERMDELISWLYKLNSVSAMLVFEQGIIESGQRDLAQELQNEYKSALLLKGPQPHRSVAFPETALRKIFAYLPMKDLKTSRLVCQTWNNLVVDLFVKHKFEVKFKSDSKTMTEFITIGQTSKIFKNLRNFCFEVQKFPEEDKTIYETFFKEFGPMKSLNLSKRMSQDLVRFIFTENFSQYLKSVVKFGLKTRFSQPFVSETTFSGLSNVEYLTVIATGEESEYGQLEFLSKFLRGTHKLKSLVLKDYFCAGRLQRDILQNAFKFNTLEELEISETTLYHINDEHLECMTGKVGKSKLKSLRISLSNVTPHVFHKFFVSHRHSLELISLNCNSNDLLAALPQFEALTRIEIGRAFNKTDDLSFLPRVTKSKKLWFSYLPSSTKENFAMVEIPGMATIFIDLSHLSISDGLPKFIGQFSTWFPNLSKIVVTHSNHLQLPFIPFSGLQQESINGRTTWSL